MNEFAFQWMEMGKESGDTGTSPHDLIDEVARTIVTTMAPHKAEAASCRYAYVIYNCNLFFSGTGTYPSDSPATETKSMPAKRSHLPQQPQEAKKKKGE
ncbi:hypothetical protein Tco_1351275 [Tanacetum coccineum]